MSYDDFIENLGRYLKSGLQDDKFQYQKNCDRRAKNTFDSLSKIIDLNECNNILDIGSGYGATCVEFAKSGKHVTGIEYNKEIFDLSLLYIKDLQLNIQILNSDASSKDILSYIQCPFELVLIEDVFEHIYDTYSLIENIHYLAAKKCYLYFNIPNGYYPDYIIDEVHKHKFGLTLLPPDLWPAVGIGSGFSIYYRSWEYYKILLNHFNFKIKRKIYLNRIKPKSELLSEINNKLEMIKKLATKSDLFKARVRGYQKNLLFDYNCATTESFFWKYGVPSWRCVFIYDKCNPMNKVNINLDKLRISSSLELFHDKDYDDYEYAFYFYFGEYVEKIWYTNKPYATSSFCGDFTDIQVTAFARHKKDKKIFSLSSLS